jgi:hypothetical protein
MAAMFSVAAARAEASKASMRVENWCIDRSTSTEPTSRQIFQPKASGPCRVIHTVKRDPDLGSDCMLPLHSLISITTLSQIREQSRLGTLRSKRHVRVCAASGSRRFDRSEARQFER